jgi:hypothetical protein
MDFSKFHDGLFDTFDGAFNFTQFDALVKLEIDPLTAFNRQLTPQARLKFEDEVDKALSDGVSRFDLEHGAYIYVNTLRHERETAGYNGRGEPHVTDPDKLVPDPLLRLHVAKEMENREILNVFGPTEVLSHVTHAVVNSGIPYDNDGNIKADDFTLADEEDEEDEDDSDFDTQTGDLLRERDDESDRQLAETIDRDARKHLAFDVVQKAAHYNKHPSGVECIELAELMSFNAGNAFKYVFRRGDKGNEKQDLEKAKWYIHREIDRLNLLIRNMPLYILCKYHSNINFTADDVEKAKRVVNTETNKAVSRTFGCLLANTKVGPYREFLRQALDNIDDLTEEL